MPIMVNHEIVSQLMKLFNMPKNVTGFIIHVSVGSILKVDCSFYPEGDKSVLPEMKHYRLEEIEEDKPVGPPNDRF